MQELLPEVMQDPNVFSIFPNAKRKEQQIFTPVAHLIKNILVL